MKVCLPISKNLGLDSPVHGHFGSAPGFLAVDTETLAAEAILNANLNHVHGGCSPVGMKKQFVTVYDESCLAQQTMLVSGGRIGTQIECAPADLIKVTRGRTAAITQEHEA